MVNRYLNDSGIGDVGDNILKQGDSLFIAHSVASDVTDMTTNPDTYFKVYEQPASSSVKVWGRTTTPIGSYHIHGSGYYRWKYSRGSDKLIKSSSTHNFHHSLNTDMLATSWSSAGSETVGSQIFTWYFPSYASGYSSEIQQIIDDVTDGNTPTPLPYLSAQIKKVTSEPVYLNHLYQSKTPIYDPSELLFRKRFQKLFGKLDF